MDNHSTINDEPTWRTAVALVCASRWRRLTMQWLSLLAPCSARGSWAVFATVDGAARRRTVALTENAKTGAATQQGLKPSDPMVQLPTDAISDGAPIRVR